MRELTRDEIRQACEAVGWEWGTFHEWSWAWSDGGDHNKIPHQSDSDVRFHVIAEHRWEGDAIALLEALVATSGDIDGYEHLSCPAGELVRLVKWADGSPDLDDDEAGASCTVKAWASGPDLPTAAVRAVNRAAEQPPQDKETV